MNATINLSDGQPCEVRRLHLYELENVAPELRDPGPFFYEIRVSAGQASFFDEYPMPEVAPDKPLVPEDAAEPGSLAAAQWDDYKTYQAALAHQVKRINIRHQRLVQIANYIFINCLSAEDRQRVKTQEDWDLIQNVAIAPEVTIEDIEATLTDVYQATFDGQPIFDALGVIKGSPAAYLAVRAWENRLMIDMGMVESEYVTMPVEERARKIGAMMLPEWSSMLSSEYNRRKNPPKKVK